jgi:hypothetical protein
MRFYLGTHQPAWLERAGVPLFVAHQRLNGRQRLPRAIAPWALDSGGFTQLQKYGRWTFSEQSYVDAVRRYAEEVGAPDFASAMDWMCEPWVLSGGTHGGQHFAGTGLSVLEHQHRTVENFGRLRELAPDLPWMPVLQGWTLAEYVDCVQLYADAGVDLTALPLVGLGSVCRRQATAEIGTIASTLAAAGISLHGFGCKLLAMRRYAGHLASADSLAWSRAGRFQRPCVHSGRVSESNCMIFALDWRDTVVDAAERGGRATQMALNVIVPGLHV